MFGSAVRSSARRSQQSHKGHSKFHARGLLLEALETRTLLSSANDIIGPINDFVVPPDYSAITAGPDGNMWFVESRGNTIGRITPDGVITEFEIPADSSSATARHPDPNLIAGPDGKLWFTVHTASNPVYQILTLTPDGQFAEVSPVQDVGIGELTTGVDGNVWYTQSNGEIGRITPQGQITEFAVDQMQAFTHITAGPDGNIWFTGHGMYSPPGNSIVQFPAGGGNGQNLVGKITPQGEISTFATDDPGYYRIDDLTAGSDGNLYYARTGGLARITTAGTITNIPRPDLGPLDLTSSEDGAIWFIDQRSVLNPLVRMDMDQSFTPYAVATPDAKITSLAAGPGGYLWFTQQSSGEIGKVNIEQGLLGIAKRINVDHKKEFTETIASFVNPGGSAEAASYTATIDWGDGNVSPGEIVANAQGGFNVVGSSTYTLGWHSFTVTITDLASGQSITLTSKAFAVAPAIAGRGTTINPEAGRTFTGSVATYVGLDTDLLARYSATIVWGDGQSSPARLVARSNGVVDVIGTHTYVKPGQFDIQVYVRESGDGVYPYPIFIDDGPIYIGTSMDTVAGEFTRVATGPLANTDVATATLSTTSYPVSTPISSFNDARTRAIVSAGLFDGDIAAIDATTGLPFDGIIARFTCANPKEDLRHYYAVVEWQATWAGQFQTARGTIEPDGHGGFTVHTSRTFLISSDMPVTVRICDDRLGEQAGTVGIAAGNVMVKSHLSIAAFPFTATAGQEFTGVVGTFTSLGTGTLWSSVFSATVNWGDGQTSTGIIVPKPDGTYDVLGTHTYEVTGFERSVYMSVSVSERRTPLDSSLPTPTNTYEGYDSTYDETCRILRGQLDAFILRVDSCINSVETNQLSHLSLATISLADPNADFTGTILWDDGGTSPALFSPYDTNFLRVSTQHIFSTPGRHTGILTVTSQGVTRTAEVSLYAYNHDPVPVQPPLAHVTIDNLVAFKGVEFTGIIGKFKPTDPTAQMAHFKATISWGDGTSSEGTITPGSDGYFNITGSHTYFTANPAAPNMRSGTLSVTVTSGSRSEYNYADYFVKIDPARVNADGRNDMKFRQREQFTSKVASFTSPLRNATADLYEAVIDWGDGTQSKGVITAGYLKTFEIAGTKTYKKSGTFTITITITGPGGPITTQSRIYVERDPVAVTPAEPIVHGGLVSGQLATFIDEDGKSTDPDRYRVSHAGLVDWGDGTVTWSLITENADGTYSVAGSHTYREEGDYLVKLVVRRNTRCLPSLTRYFNDYDRNGFCDAITSWSLGSANGATDGPSEEYATALFKVHITLPTVSRPRQPRPAPTAPPVAKQDPHAPLAGVAKAAAKTAAAYKQQTNAAAKRLSRRAIPAKHADADSILTYRWKRDGAAGAFSQNNRVLD
ncbi:MAG TPA: hypothetical protein VHP11_15110 [Tepidisphaeraceae bacterium]|nr:hypothetical protein [Tepidisphaeraceae bacterium]